MSDWIRFKDFPFENSRNLSNWCNDMMVDIDKWSSSYRQLHCRKYDILIQKDISSEEGAKFVLGSCMSQNQNNPVCLAQFQCVVALGIYKETNAQKEKLELYEKVIKENPDDSNAHLVRAGINGQIFMYMDNIRATVAQNWKKVIEDYFDKEIQGYADMALSDYSKAIELDPNNAKFYAFRGGFYYQLKNNKGALADLNKAIELDGKCKWAYSFRGSMYYDKGEYAKAVADLEYISKFYPDESILATLKLAKEKKAEADAKNQKKYDDAVAQFNRLKAQVCKTSDNYEKAGKTYGLFIAVFRELSSYKNTDAFVEQCQNSIKECETKYTETRRKEEEERIRTTYTNAMAKFDALKNKAVSDESGYKEMAADFNSLAGTFRGLGNHEDSKSLSEQCKTKYEEYNALHDNAVKERERREAEEEAKKEAAKRKKKLIGVLAGVAAIAILIGYIVYRQTGSFFQFEQNDQGTLAIIGYSGTKNVIIPEADKKNNRVTEIRDWAFQGKKLVSVTIPDSITIIGASAFEDNQLTNVVIPDSVTTIGASAFEDNQLTNVVIPDSVTSIGNNAFFKNKLRAVTIGNSVTIIGDFAFSGNVDSNNNLTNDGNQLTSVVIPDSVITIGQRAFRNNQLSSVTIGNSVETIGNRAFSTNRLTSVDIPGSVTTIDEAAFINNRLASVVIPNGVTTIGRLVFQENQLTSVTIPNSVTSIKENAFRENRLTSMSIPNSITSIETNAFADNPITSVRLGANVTLGSDGAGSVGVLGRSTGFNTAYRNNNNRAGTYSRPNTDSTTWTRR